MDMGELGVAGTEAWTVARDIPVEAFLARDKKHPISIRSVTIDRGPRRIVIVADNGKEMTVGAREIEAAVITDILSKARAEDSFGLLTARGPRIEFSLHSRPEVIQAAAEKLETSAQGQSQTSEGVLDALLEASIWLQPPRPGDSIFLLAMRVEGKNRVSVSRVRRALGAGRIRLFSFQLGPASIWGPTFMGVPTSAEISDGMFSLTSRTGGVGEWENTGEYRYESQDVRLQQLRDIAEQMYNAITEYYVVELSSVGPHVAISLSPEFEKRLLVPMDVLYPRDLPSCKSP